MVLDTATSNQVCTPWELIVFWY